MTETLLTWIGIDDGQENLLLANNWLSVLKVLGDHEGESHRDINSPLFNDLFRYMPQKSWLGRDGTRSFFRDYGKSWKDLGALDKDLINSTGVIALTKIGKELVANQTSIHDFFRQAIDNFSLESVKTIDGQQAFRINPFWALSYALLNIGNTDLERLRRETELAATSFYPELHGLNFTDHQRNSRRFNNFVRLLANAGSIRFEKKNIEVLDSRHLLELTAGVADDFTLEAVAQENRAAPGPEQMQNDTRRRKLVEAVAREGQKEFRDSLLDAYGSTCAVTGTKEISVLEAAHIMNYRGRQTNTVKNGILLAVDVHRLLDANLLAINPTTLRIELSPELKDSRYKALAGIRLNTPNAMKLSPSADYLREKYNEFTTHNR